MRARISSTGVHFHASWLRVHTEHLLQSLADCPGIPYTRIIKRLDEHMVCPGDYHCYPDASGPEAVLQALGGYMHGRFFKVHLTELQIRWLHITARELLTCLVLGVVFFKFVPKGARIVIHCDALAAVCTLSKQQSKSEVMQHIYQQILRSPAFADRSEFIHVVHLYGAGNPMGDGASRGYSKLMQGLAQQLKVPLIEAEVPSEVGRLIEEVTAKAAATPEYAGSIGAVVPAPHKVDYPAVQSQHDSMVRLFQDTKLMGDDGGDGDYVLLTRGDGRCVVATLVDSCAHMLTMGITAEMGQVFRTGTMEFFCERQISLLTDEWDKLVFYMEMPRSQWSVANEVDGGNTLLRHLVAKWKELYALCRAWLTPQQVEAEFGLEMAQGMRQYVSQHMAEAVQDCMDTGMSVIGMWCLLIERGYGLGTLFFFCEEIFIRTTSSSLGTAQPSSAQLRKP
jgi:hypothetical protein